MSDTPQIACHTPMDGSFKGNHAEAFVNGLWKQNPVFVQVLGMCPTLAITNSVRNAIAMGLATTFVLVCSNGLVSAVRKMVPKQVRIATYIADHRDVGHRGGLSGESDQHRRV